MMIGAYPVTFNVKKHRCLTSEAWLLGCH